MIPCIIIIKKEQAKKSSQIYMIPYTIINKKEQAKKVVLGLYDLLYYDK